MERNALAFDISEPAGALNFAAFLFRLSRTHGAELAKRLTKPCKAIREGKRELLDWTQNHQNPKPNEASAAAS